MERWINKIAIITGAGSGIGAACTKALLEKGMIVVGLDVCSERMEKELKPTLSTEQQSRFYAKKCDVSKEEQILFTFKWVEETLGGIEVLINNAGIAHEMQMVTENNSNHLRSLLDVNVLGYALCTREAFRSMKMRGSDGHIVLINSIAGHTVPNIPGIDFNLYPSTKYAITAMTEVLRQEFLLNETKIKITSISPGAVDTRMTGDDFKKFLLENNLPRLMPADVADAIVYCIQTPPHVQIHELTIQPVGAFQ